MAKVPPLTDVQSGYNLAQAYNANNEKIEEAFQNTLSRDGSAPNMMGVDLDMNSNRVINTLPPVNQNDVATKKFVEDYVNLLVGEGEMGVLPPLLWGFAGNGVTTVFALPGGTSNNSNNYIVTLNGVRQTPTVDYTVAAEQITFTTPPGPEIESILVQVVGTGLEGPQGVSGIIVAEVAPDNPYIGLLWLDIS